MPLQNISKVSKYEAKYILSALSRLKSGLLDSADLCSHSHEKDFWHLHNTLICKKGKEKDTLLIHLVNSLNIKFMDIAVNEPQLKSLIMEFKKGTKHLYKSEMLLKCIVLLVKYHKKAECSDYLSLALKLKLFLYWAFDGYKFHAAPHNIIMKEMLNFLRYISVYKCKHVLFISYIDVFVEHYFGIEFVDYLQPAISLDYIQPILSQVLDAAHELRFNFFRPWNSRSLLMEKKYIQRSIQLNVKRYLILVKYGYEDQRYKRAFYYYDLYIKADDLYNLFGFQRRFIRRRSNKKYRSYQVLHLYIKAYYDEDDYGKDLYDEALRVLWNSIPDPFLLKQQFLSSFEQSDKFPEFMNVWKWYAKVVLNNIECEKSPRSLKHLTRCSIRRVLTESVQTPFGIGSLDIPATVKSYLSLADVFSVELED